MAKQLETPSIPFNNAIKYAAFVATAVLLGGCAGGGDRVAPSQVEPYVLRATPPNAYFSDSVVVRDPLAGVGPADPATHEAGKENFVAASLVGISEFWRRGRRIAWNRWAEEYLQEGDIVFVQSEGNMVLGLIDFSKLTSEVTGSPFTHMGIVAIENGQVLVYDMNLTGAGRKTFGHLMAMPDTAGVAVKRLARQYRHHIPTAMAYCRRVHEHQLEFDKTLRLDNDKLYCSELVEVAFRTAGLRLSQPIRWDALPGFDEHPIAVNAIRIANGAEADEYVIIPGNDRIGIWSSPTLEFVLDLTAVDSPPNLPGFEHQE